MRLSGHHKDARTLINWEIPMQATAFALFTSDDDFEARLATDETRLRAALAGVCETTFDRTTGALLYLHIPLASGDRELTFHACPMAWLGDQDFSRWAVSVSGNLDGDDAPIEVEIHAESRALLRALRNADPELTMRPNGEDALYAHVALAEGRELVFRWAGEVPPAS